MSITQKILEEKKSAFNGKIKVVRTLGLGTYIQVDGLTQSGGVVKGIWRSTIRRVKGKRHEVKDCLILGLGGGTVVKLIRKYWPNAKITGVDVDPVMVEMGKKYLGLNKIEIEIEDAKKYLILNTKYNIPNYGLILVDLYCGYEYPKKFEDESFLKLIHRLLSDKGVVVFNRLYSDGRRKEAIKFGEKLEKVFSKVEWFYPSANLMFICIK